MSMPIQRQSESFGYFDDGPRYARDRSSTELPRGLAGLINTSGPRITAGLLNTRTAGVTDPDPSDQEGVAEMNWPGWKRRNLDEDGQPYQDWPNPNRSPEQRRDEAYQEWISRGAPHHGSRTASCDYCGEEGHDWDIHPEAHRDVAEWEREKSLLEFPFGDHREAFRLAVNVDGMDPASHAYHQESYGGPYDAGGGWVGDEDGYRAPRRDWNPDYGYEPTDEDERNHELVGEDDDSGYNWGPEPHPEDEYGPGPSPDFHDGSPLPFDTPIYNPRSAPYDTHTGSRHPFDRTASGGHGVPWEEDGEGGWHHPVGGFRVVPSDEEPGRYQLLAPHVGRGSDLAKVFFPHDDPHALMEHATYSMGGPKPTTKVSFAPAPPVPGAHAYQPAHRVGLPWRDQVIPGTVIGLDGPHVAIRWDDGQYSNEEPHNIRLL